MLSLVCGGFAWPASRGRKGGGRGREHEHVDHQDDAASREHGHNDDQDGVKLLVLLIIVIINIVAEI